MDYKIKTYMNKKEGALFKGSIIEDNIFVVLEIGEGIDEIKGNELLSKLKTQLFNLININLLGLDSTISDFIKENNLPMSVSLSSGFVKDNILLLKTTGEGKILIKRKGEVMELISGDKTASGYIEKNDLFVFTTNKFDSNRIDDSEDQPTSILIDFSTEEIVIHNNRPIINKQSSYDETIRKSLKDYYARFGHKKTITFVVVLLIFIILVWSVGLGYSRRVGKEARKKISLTKELITQKLKTAGDVSTLNTDRALVLISESKSELDNLKKQYKDNKDLVEIENLIAESEKKILKKEDKNYTEFFDLTLDDKTAKGDRLYLEGDSLSILDREGGRIYSLSLEKKSLVKNQTSEIKKATLIASYDETNYFYIPNYGVYEITTDGKAKKVIENDKEWGTISDFWLFNGNIYLLDTGKDEIFKYLNGGDIFGSKNSYFASGQAVDLSWVKSLAIDSSLYLGGSNNIIKFTSGLRDGFKTNLPNTNVNFDRIFTSKDLDSVYAWDKNASIVYVLDKDGEFKSQITSSILNRASDLVVYDDSIFVLIGSKIFKI